MSSFIAAGTVCGWWIIFCIKQHVLYICRSSTLSTLNPSYRAFVSDFSFLNWRIFSILFCVIFRGCKNFLFVFAYISAP